MSKHSVQEEPGIDVQSFRRYVFRRLDGIAQDESQSDQLSQVGTESLRKRLRGLLDVLNQIEGRMTEARIESQWQPQSLRQSQ